MVLSPSSTWLVEQLALPQHQHLLSINLEDARGEYGIVINGARWDVVDLAFRRAERDLSRSAEVLSSLPRLWCVDFARSRKLDVWLRPREPPEGPDAARLLAACSAAGAAGCWVNRYCVDDEFNQRHGIEYDTAYVVAVLPLCHTAVDAAVLLLPDWRQQVAALNQMVSQTLGMGRGN